MNFKLLEKVLWLDMKNTYQKVVSIVTISE